VMLPREFFARSAVEVAPSLLGRVIGHQTADGLVAVVLTEVEAYEGQADPASHAFRGRTPRNAVMFGPPGHCYVYFTYGMHFCVNLVCLPEGTASAVLLRAGRVVAGATLAAARRGGGNGARPPAERDLARGPARLCQALGITRALDGADVCDPASPLRVWQDARSVPAAGAGSVAGAGPVAGAGSVAGAGLVAGGGSAAGAGSVAVSRGPRVGVSAAADRPWRFWLTGEPTVSVYRPHVPRRARRPKPVSAPGPRDGTIPL
jgi:DNA-3-methyladenine glycosylase